MKTRSSLTAARFAGIHSGPHRSGDSSFATRDQDRWFWVDDRDLETKRVSAFMMMRFALTDTGEKENASWVVIPAQ